VTGENDLIEVELALRPTSMMNCRLQRGSPALKVWTTRDKQSEIVFSGANGSETGDLAFDVYSTVLTVWVEWVGVEHGTADLLLKESRSSLVLDTLVFHSFRSIIVAFGGNGQEPSDPPNANHGTFQIPVDLYRHGYDAWMYNEEDVDASGLPPYSEVRRAIQERGVTQVAILGYSQGGGATYALSDQLANNPPTGNWQLAFTAYIDAVIHNGWNPETRRPRGSAYHVNYWQHTPSGILRLRGDRGANDSFELDVNTVAWGINLDHFTVDDHQNVIDRIEHGSTAAAPEGPHDGLDDRVTR
jgi:hypothetical protein